MTYDAARQRVLLFGGNAGTTFMSDLWAWDGTRWTRLATDGPPARAGAVLAYDPTTQMVLLYGGANGHEDLTDLWRWNGAAWSQVAAPGGPPIAHASGGFDAARHRLVIHRGYSGSAPQRDTWEWDGTQWTQAATASPVDYAVPLPSPMVYDAARPGLLMFIGDAASKACTLWHWSGTAWTNLGAAPSLVTPAPLALLGSNDALVIEGSPAGGGAAVTHRWNGTTWAALPGPGPARRFGGAMVFDPAHGHVVLFGGQAAGGEALGDTWTWDGAWHAVPR